MGDICLCRMGDDASEAGDGERCESACVAVIIETLRRVTGVGAWKGDSAEEAMRIEILGIRARRAWL